MWLNLLVLLMVVLIAFFQARQGLFAALILLVLSVLSSVVAFSFYEDLYAALVAEFLPAEGQAVSLMAIFLVTLIALRLVVDMGIKGNVLIPQKVDRAGGGVLGFFVALVMTGTTMTAVQMLPFDKEVLGFNRHEAAGEKVVTRGVWFGADRFAVGLVDLILDGSLAGKVSGKTRPEGADPTNVGRFEDVHPDFLSEVDARRSAGVPTESKPGDATIKVEQVWAADRVLDREGKAQASPESGAKFLAVRVQASGNLPGAFTPLQMRLVGTRANRLEVFHLRAASRDNDIPSLLSPTERYSLSSGTMNLVYEIPSTVTPWYVTFDGRSLAEVKESKDQVAPSLAAPAGAEPKKEEKKDAAAPPKPAAKNPPGRTHGADVAGDPVVSEDLPGGISIASNDLAGTEAELAGSRFKGGHIVMPTSKLSKVKIVGTVGKFEVPKGYKMVQIPLHRLMPGSLAGQAIDFAVRTLQQQWVLKDDAGGNYFPVGAMAMAKSGSEELVELQYHVSQEELAAGHTLTKWRRITDQDLKTQPDAKLVFVYLVPPGKHIVAFDTGRQAVEIDLAVK